ncbi:MAG: endospore germination permease [Clostridia bacterium]|nr:endospore germination permease [Clostridia bacterium]
MVEKAKISSSQLWLLLFTNVVATGVLFVPAVTTLKGKQDAWLSIAVVATIFGLLTAIVISSLAKRFPRETIMDFSISLWGRVLGKIVGLLYMFYFIHSTGIIVRQFGEFLVTAFMPETPLEVFNLVLVILAASAVRNGIEVIVRMNQFVIPLILIIFLGLIVLGIPDWQPEELLPMLEKGWGRVMEASLTPVFWRSQIALTLMLIPFLNNHQETRISLIKAVLVIGFILTVETMAAIMIFGNELIVNYVFPTFYLARYISIFEFVERLESLIIVVWVAGVTVKVALWYYCAVLAAAQWFQLKNHKPVVLPIGVLVLYFSVFLFANTREIVEHLSTQAPFLGLFFTFVVPALLWLTAIIRRQGGGKVG